MDSTESILFLASPSEDVDRAENVHCHTVLHAPAHPVSNCAGENLVEQLNPLQQELSECVKRLQKILEPFLKEGGVADSRVILKTKDDTKVDAKPHKQKEHARFDNIRSSIGSLPREGLSPPGCSPPKLFVTDTDAKLDVTSCSQALTLNVPITNSRQDDALCGVPPKMNSITQECKASHGSMQEEVVGPPTVATGKSMPVPVNPTSSTDTNGHLLTVMTTSTDSHCSGHNLLTVKPPCSSPSGNRSSNLSLASGISLFSYASRLTDDSGATKVSRMKSTNTVNSVHSKIAAEVSQLTKMWDRVTKSEEDRRLSDMKTQRAVQFRLSEESQIGICSHQSWWDENETGVHCLKKIVSHSLFDMLFGIIVVTNALYLGIEVDLVASHPSDEVPLSYRVTGYIYTALFLVELVLRLIADCRGFLCADFKQACWNYLDVLVVMASIVEVGLDVVKETLSTGNGNADLTKLRISSITRIARLLRLFRIGRILKFVCGLRVLIMSILNTLKSVMWSLVLLIIIIYVFAIMFTQAASDYFIQIEVYGKSPTLSDQEANDLTYYWGSIGDSMLVLFMAVSGGVNYESISKPLRLLSIFWLMIFLLFIGFVHFAVLNVVTGIFCQSAIETSQNDQEAMVQSFIRHKEVYMDRFKTLFNTIDADASGLITKEELENNIQIPQVQAYFHTLGIDPYDARSLFRLLDSTNPDDCDWGIDVEDFVDGCIRLKGHAKGVDLARVMQEQKILAREVCAMRNQLREQTAMIRDLKLSANRQPGKFKSVSFYPSESSGVSEKVK